MLAGLIKLALAALFEGWLLPGDKPSVAISAGTSLGKGHALFGDIILCRGGRDSLVRRSSQRHVSVTVNQHLYLAVAQPSGAQLYCGLRAGQKMTVVCVYPSAGLL
jgi:hypothetical protein